MPEAAVTDGGGVCCRLRVPEAALSTLEGAVLPSQSRPRCLGALGGRRSAHNSKQKAAALVSAGKEGNRVENHTEVCEHLSALGKGIFCEC